MKLKINFKKVISTFILIVVICTTITGLSNPVYGKVNEEYTVNDDITYIDVSKATENSDVLNAIASFIYALAGFVEKIVSNLMGMFTGTEMFPWADTVVFNAVRFLDINFLSPSTGSMFRDISGGDTIFGGIIRNIYYTIFVLSITFFGVVVGIMALKLAISSIAAEKAKYKQAITNWLLALILLFTAHYLISFIFFVNEKMVEVASTILEDASKKQGSALYIDTSGFDIETKAAIFDKVISGSLQSEVNAAIPIHKKENDPNFYGLVISFSPNNGIIIAPARIYSDLTVKYGQPLDNSVTKSFVDNFMTLVFTKEYMAVRDGIVDYESLAYGHLTAIYGEDHEFQIEDIWENLFSVSPINIFSVGGDLLNLATGAKERDIERLFMDALAITYSDEAIMNQVATNIQKNIPNSSDFETMSSESYINSYHSYQVKNNYNGEDNYPSNFRNIFLNAAVSNSSSKNSNVFTGLGQFFKNSVYGYTYDNNGNMVGFSATQFNPIPAILYSIFVIQSIMYFIAYLKRFFYIIVLALFAPLVIVYDFLTKTAMS